MTESSTAGTTLTVVFPFGRYHATPWDQGPNSGAVEWPPSPWRLFRALIAVGHSRCPELTPTDIDELLIELGNPDAYWSSEAAIASTRHYMPDGKHVSREPGNTDQVVDAFAITRSTPLVHVHWDKTISNKGRLTFALLADRLPYLGRSESICVAKVSVGEHSPDGAWWRKGVVAQSDNTITVVGADSVPKRNELEQTTFEIRRRGDMYPPGSVLIPYGRETPPCTHVGTAVAADEKTIRAIQFELVSSVPMRMRNLVLLTDAFHQALRKHLGEVPLDQLEALVGREGGGVRTNQHDHAHILVHPNAIAADMFDAESPATTLTLWVPGGISQPIASEISRRVGSLGTNRSDLEDRFPEQRLLALGAGALSEVMPAHLFRSSARWRAMTPYLPVRHRKNKHASMADFLLEDIGKEAEYRGLPRVISVEVEETRHAARNLSQYRRYRMSQTMAEQRKGVFCTIEFESAPESSENLMTLGQLSHFGFGWFAPASGLDNRLAH